MFGRSKEEKLAEKRADRPEIVMDPSERRTAMKKDPKIFFSRLVHDHYIIYPLIASGMWLGGILGLIALWVQDGKPRYMPDEASVVFVSDVGATYHTFFIVITAVTGGTYIISVLAARWLRHVDRLPMDVRKREKIFDFLACFWAIVGAVGLILLGIFDAFEHPTIHWSMTVVFVLGTAISAIWQSAEVWSLHKDHPDRQHLRRNSIFKLVVVTLAIALAIGFAVCYGICDGNADTARCEKITSAAAALEWAVSFVLTFYFLTLVLDLWPAGKSSPRYMRRLAKWQEQHEGRSTEHDFTGRPAFNQKPEAWQGNDGRALPVDANHNDVNGGYANSSLTGTHHNGTNGYAPPAQPNYAAPESARPSTAYGSDAGLVRGQAMRG